MKVEKQVKYTYALTDKERELIASLKDIGEQLDADGSDVFKCPGGCDICPFRTVGETCPFILLDNVITKIIKITDKIEKGETVCRQ